MNDYLCPRCGKLLFKGAFVGTIETKCRACKHIVAVENRRMIEEKKLVFGFYGVIK